MADGQNIFLIRIWSLSTGSWLTAPRASGISCDKSHEGVFYVNVMTFRKPFGNLKIGGTNPVIRGLELSAPNATGPLVREKGPVVESILSDQ